MEHEDYNGCYCARCLKENGVTIGGSPFGDCRMILCQICGNKRCPKATDCRLKCTGSNAPGQKGSSYEAFSMAEIDGEQSLVASPVAWGSKMESQVDDRHFMDRTFRCGDTVRLIKLSDSGTPPMERIKSGILMLEYLQTHWGSLNRILNAVQECPNAFGTRVGEDCFASAADFLEAKAAEYKRAISQESFGVAAKRGSLP